MATKLYGIKDNWTDDDVANVIEVASEDGSVSSVKVNGEEYGGGGGGVAHMTVVISSGSYVTSDYIAYVYENKVYVGQFNPISNNDVLDLAIASEGQSSVKLYTGFETTPTINGSAVLESFSKGVAEFTITGDCTITVEGIDRL